MPLQQLRILIVIEQELFAGGLFRLFRDKNGLPLCDIINCSKHLIYEDTFDTALIDLSSPRVNGEGAIRRILKSFPNAKINMLSLYVDTNVKRQLKEAGIKGYLEDNSKAFQFVESIKQLMVGDEYFGNNYKSLIKSKKINFSDRELQVLRLIVAGYTDLEIADTLHIVAKTVNGYRKKLIAKLGVRNTAELVAVSIREGHIPF